MSKVTVELCDETIDKIVIQELLSCRENIKEWVDTHKNCPEEEAYYFALNTVLRLYGAADKEPEDGN